MEILVKELTVLVNIFCFLVPVIPVTLKIAVVSFILALILGLIVALMKVSHFGIFKLTARVYVDVIRGIPLLVQIFFIYFGLGKILNLEQLPASILARSIWYSAYLGEIIRAGIEAIPEGQVDASRSLGMNTYQTMRYIVLPQAFRIVLPPISNEFIACLKDTSLVSIIGLRELTRAGREYYSQYFVDFETWFMVGLIYLAMTVALSKVSHFIETKYKIT